MCRAGRPRSPLILLDVHESWANPVALKVNVGLAEYFAKVFAALSDAPMEQMLHTEYGGLNESFAELSVQTGDKRWLEISERIYDHKVLDGLEAGQDDLANLHANTQVPKLIGLARIHELTNKPAPGEGARFFWIAVTQHHSYVIGGNADREYFSAPDTIAAHITEQTCDHCNTYNMLKLTRHVYTWSPDASFFDYYECAHLNHVMAAQNPATAGWAKGNATVTVNGKAVTPAMSKGYAIVERKWKQGDTVAITLPLELRLEATPGDDSTVAVLRGPMVMAADLGPTSEKWDSPDPAMVGQNLLGGFQAAPAAERVSFQTHGVLRPADLTFVPFYSQYERRSAVYFKRFTDEQWKQEQAAFVAEQEHLKDIAARSVDVMHLGEMQPERDHNLASQTSYPVVYRGRQGRDARAGGYFEFTMKTKPGPLVLMATYWGDEPPRSVLAAGWFPLRMDAAHRHPDRNHRRRGHRVRALHRRRPSAH